MLSSRWPRSPSHGKCSGIFCGSSRSYGRSHHPRQRETFDCHAFKRNRQEECVQMPVKIARSTPRPSFGLRELLVASHISRLASRDAAKSLLSTLVSESSGECRFRAEMFRLRPEYRMGKIDMRSAKILVKELFGRYGYEIHWPIRQLCFDAATMTIIEQTRPFTLTSPERIFALKNAIEYVIKYDIPGDIVECGVWKGGSMMAAALTLLNLGVKRPLYLFDTFAGMTPPTAVDHDFLGRSAT